MLGFDYDAHDFVLHVFWRMFVQGTEASDPPSVRQGTTSTTNYENFLITSSKYRIAHVV